VPCELAPTSWELDATLSCPRIEPWKEPFGSLSVLYWQLPWRLLDSHCTLALDGVWEPHWRRLDGNYTPAHDGVQVNPDGRHASRDAEVHRASDSPGENPRSELASSQDSLPK
jgi:hypothetical protein